MSDYTIEHQEKLAGLLWHCDKKHNPELEDPRLKAVYLFACQRGYLFGVVNRGNDEGLHLPFPDIGFKPELNFKERMKRMAQPEKNIEERKLAELQAQFAEEISDILSINKPGQIGIVCQLIKKYTDNLLNLLISTPRQNGN